jgi:UDP-glucose 4-epimerase
MKVFTLLLLPTSGSRYEPSRSAHGKGESVRRLRRALVLGGAGFLGTWLIESLASRGLESVVAVDNLSTGRVENVARENLVVADVSGPLVTDIVRERAPDAVFHLAGPSYVPPSLEAPIDDLMASAGRTLEVLETIRCIERPPLFVFISSAAVYGNAVYTPMDEGHPLLPMSPYGVSKLAAEQYVRLYASLYGIPATIVRPFSIYGPGQRKQVVYDLLCRAFADGDELTVLGEPQVERDLVFVEDAAAAIVLVAERAPALGEAYNIAAGRPTTLGELADAILRISGSQKTVRFTGAVRPGDPLRWHGSTAKVEALGARFPTRVEEGLARTAAWLQAGKTAASDA